MKQFTKRFLPVVMLLALLPGTTFAEGKRFVFGIHSIPKEIPEITFEDLEEQQFTLEDFEGKYLLLNVWATWCPPCRKELPDLQGLQQKLGGQQFQVVALSTDAGKRASVLRLYQELGLDEDSIFIDQTGSAMRKLGIFAMPTTLLIDPEGREIGRKPGPADWDSTSALTFFQGQLASPE
ncbi:TlpA family protein disulfide reductase [Sulfitobacter sp. M13]